MIDPEVIARIQQLSKTLLHVQFARRVWTKLLSAADRERLGNDFVKAFKKHPSVVHLWSHLRHCSGERAVIQLAYEIDLIDDEEARGLARAFGERPVRKLTPKRGNSPLWDPEVGPLEFEGRGARTFRSNARI